MTDFTITQVDFDRLLDQNDEEQTVRLFCFEQLLYRWADRLSCEYQGGLWLGMTLSNGGFYAYPATSQNWSVSAENYYQGTMDSDTFGITASLYALCELANRTEADEDIEAYYALRNYALMHSCTNAIMAAID
ncbi:antirestriction protein [Klebsiella michiganensis]|uniref:antirestriction protein n=1 Tax=Klebsiella michiganensis TaxID=1134687 RepID=UPI0038841D95